MSSTIISVRRRLQADFISEADKLIRNTSRSAARIALGMLFTRYALREGWPMSDIEKVTEEAYASDRNATGDDIGAGTLGVLLSYCERGGSK